VDTFSTRDSAAAATTAGFSVRASGAAVGLRVGLAAAAAVFASSASFLPPPKSLANRLGALCWVSA